MFQDHLAKAYPSVISFLTNAINKNKLANSYIFIGQDSDDIFSIVSNLAKILNCKENRFATPCGNCINCRWLDKNEHPQALMVIKPDSDSKKEQIKIDSIRELLNSLTITSESFKIVFFQNANLNSLPPECSNLLLKTVEETPERTMFVFSTTTKYDILPTILSRSQTIYISKKSDSIFNIGKIQDIPKSITDSFSSSLKAALENVKQSLEFLENKKGEINLKDFLFNLSKINYSTLKYEKQFCTLYNHLTEAHKKHKSFMQPKIILEDLFLNLAP